MVNFLRVLRPGLPLAAITLAASLDLPPRSLPKKCPPFKGGDFAIDYFQLYPENADWDQDRCVVWIGCVWNATVAIYDPYARKVTQVLEIPGTSHTGSQHIGGVAWDPHTGLVTILTDSARPWETGGTDISGEHLIIKYDAVRKKTLWTLNISDLTHERYGGFQDIETDRRGNTYVAVRPWYLPDPLPPTTKMGFGGLAAVPGTEILLSVDGDGRLYRFDMRDDVGKPVSVPAVPDVRYTFNDAVYLPPKYGGRVLLNSVGLDGVQVLRSQDKWDTAENMGTIPHRTSPEHNGIVVTATVQIGEPGSIYTNLGFWDQPWVPGTVAGNRTAFPMPDITKEIEALLTLK
ncbi:hypothetical protein B0H67DRAFT_642330 [Lasiosphaeris hirsuta]|uniref:Uncharacterized protein n=1 Tax=Lasiosphaeris hirsuta TaxID=260670 RepID=A0AA40B1J8_9PEZI|nr:hypothetical protein B0H67DRAFT_642330 [Lasiosphaeris hirsuta]